MNTNETRDAGQGSTATAAVNRPWPVVLLTALGAWLAAGPILVAVGLLLGDVVMHGMGPYVVGSLALAAAVVVLRSENVPLFFEQLAVPALLVGVGLLGVGVFSDLKWQGGSVVMAAVVVGLAVVLAQAWLRTLLGANAAALLGLALVADADWNEHRLRAFWVLHSLLAAWLVVCYLTRQLQHGADAKSGSCASPTAAHSHPAWLVPFAAGWLLACLAGLVWVTGNTFLLGGAVLGGGSSGTADLARYASGDGPHGWVRHTLSVLSCALVLAAAAWAGRAWRGVQNHLALALAVIIATLALLMPTLGAAVLALVVCALLRRWLIAGACAVAVVWVLGSFYYLLDWTLGDKALLLLGAGLLLGGLVWWEHRRGQRGQRGHASGNAGTTTTTPSAATTTASPPARYAGARPWLMAGSAALTLVVANGAIWQKQDLIAHGKRVLIALAPADPRSLMQGDYMRLRFTALEDGKIALLQDLAGQRPHMVMRLAPNGVATALRAHDDAQALAPDEILLELSPKNGGWVVVTDAWFFKEGDGQRFEAARYGEFRVLPSGKALLVGVADAGLNPIAVGP